MIVVYNIIYFKYILHLIAIILPILNNFITFVIKIEKGIRFRCFLTFADTSRCNYFYKKYFIFKVTNYTRFQINK